MLLSDQRTMTVKPIRRGWQWSGSDYSATQLSSFRRRTASRRHSFRAADHPEVGQSSQY